MLTAQNSANDTFSDRLALSTQIFGFFFTPRIWKTEPLRDVLRSFFTGSHVRKRFSHCQCATSFIIVARGHLRHQFDAGFARSDHIPFASSSFHVLVFRWGTPLSFPPGVRLNKPPQTKCVQGLKHRIADEQFGRGTKSFVVSVW